MVVAVVVTVTSSTTSGALEHTCSATMVVGTKDVTELVAALAANDNHNEAHYGAREGHVVGHELDDMGPMVLADYGDTHGRTRPSSGSEEDGNSHACHNNSGGSEHRSKNSLADTYNMVSVLLGGIHHVDVEAMTEAFACPVGKTPLNTLARPKARVVHREKPQQYAIDTARSTIPLQIP